VPCDTIQGQGQGHEALEVLNSNIFEVYLLCHLNIIIIIIMTRRRLWSVATTLHDVHVAPRSATFVSSWPEFPCRPAVSMSSGDTQEVFASSYPDNDQLSFFSFLRALVMTLPCCGALEIVWVLLLLCHCNDLFQCLVCWCGGVQSNDMTEQRVTSLCNYCRVGWYSKLL